MHLLIILESENKHYDCVLLLLLKIKAKKTVTFSHTIVVFYLYRSSFTVHLLVTTLSHSPGSTHNIFEVLQYYCLFFKAFFADCGLPLYIRITPLRAGLCPPPTLLHSPWGYNAPEQWKQVWTSYCYFHLKNSIHDSLIEL